MFNFLKKKKEENNITPPAVAPADDENAEWVFKIGKKLELIDWLNEVWHTDTVSFKKDGVVMAFGKVGLMKWRQTAKGYILYYPAKNSNLVHGPWVNK